MEAGVPHVICCRGRVFDGACKTFTKAYGFLCSVVADRELRDGTESGNYCIMGVYKGI